MYRRILFLAVCWIVTQANAQPNWMRAPKVDSLAIRKQVSDYFRWYAAHWKKVEAIPLYITNSADTGQRHRMDWKAVARYERLLRTQVPMVGEAYIRAERAFFKRADSAFRADPQEEMAFGFTYDRWVNAQEYPSYVVPFILDPNRKWEVLVADNRALVYLYYLNPSEGRDKIQLEKERGRWKIASLIEIDETYGDYEKN